MDADAGRDPETFQSLVIADPVRKIRVEECQMVQAGAALRFLERPWNRGEGEPMMLVVISHKGQDIISEQDLGAENFFVPVDHFCQARSPEDRVRQARGADGLAIT